MKYAALLVLAACSGSEAPHSRAQRIGKLEEAVGGPHAIGQVGDWLLENDKVKFVIADKGVGRVNTTFGGTLVDADIQRVNSQSVAAGNDEMAELLPGFVFTVINPTDVCVPTLQGACPTGPDDVLADGADGRPAEVMVTGIGGDLFEMVALLNTGLVFPSDLTMTQVYKLEPGKSYVTIETTIKNTSTGAHPFPYLDPTQLDGLLGQNIPGISNIMLSAPLGQFPLMGGEQNLFAPGPSGFNVRFSIEDSYDNVGGFPAFPGRVVDYLASRGPNVSYGLALVDSDDNYANAYASGYPGQEVTKHSMLLPFEYAGVTGAYMFKPPAQLMAGEQKTFTSYFLVGHGDVASIYDSILELRNTMRGQFGGRVVDEMSSAPVAGARVVVFDSTGTNYIDEIDTAADGTFVAQLPVGMYRYIVSTDDRLPAAMDAANTIQATPQPFAITDGEKTGVYVQMHAPATIAVQARDELGRLAPVKIQLIGHDNRIDPPSGPVDGRNILYSLGLGERVRVTAFDGTDRYIENAWWTTNGRLEATVRPGTYDVVITRGPEYEVASQTVTIGANQFATVQLSLQRSFDTPGWISGDFHIHAAPSTDSGTPIADRVASCAAEGLEVATATDHNYITDYAPVIAQTGLDQWLLGIPGMELTTFEMGHFNGYPLKVDPGSTRGGEFVWAKQPPQKLFDQLRALAIDPNNSVVQINHPRQQVLGYWAQFFVDAATAEPYTPTGILGVFAPYGDEFQASNYSLDADAVELLTGRRLEDVHTAIAPDPLPSGTIPDPQPTPGQVIVGKDGRPLYPGTVETWFTMLDRGKRMTGMGTSDSHHLLGDEPGYARTLLYVGDGKDQIGEYSRDDVVAAIRGHHTEVTNAPFIDMKINDAVIGDDVKVSGQVTVAIHVRAPSWAPVNHIKVYSNSAVIFDQAITTGTDYSTNVMFTPGKDAWVVAEVLGDSNMFPVNSPTEFPPLDVGAIITALASGLDLSSLPISNPLKPIQTHYSKPYAITNPIWIDADGDGKWTPPKAPLSERKVPTSRNPPDVRAAFDALPEVSR
ncbi:MAG: CehA/McbA family metallohydrolase [Kofleriaceae bacterium]